MSDDDKKDDATHVGGAPPAMPKLPGGAPPPAQGETTHLGARPPQLPKPGAPPPADDDDAEGEETVAIGQVPQRTPFSLQRIQPPGHTGVVYLAGAAYLLGRKQGADLPLFSPTASREHARLERRSDGWYVEAIEGKAVIVNGSLLRAAARLEHKTRIQLGGDELIFFDETAVAAAPAFTAPAAESRRSHRVTRIAIAVLVLLAVAGVLAWMLRR
jgi:pSer/pThr/pTyr-binding forkhead associated (FHA) protein